MWPNQPPPGFQPPGGPGMPPAQPYSGYGPPPAQQAPMPGYPQAHPGSAQQPAAPYSPPAPGQYAPYPGSAPPQHGQPAQYQYGAGQPPLPQYGAPPQPAPAAPPVPTPPAQLPGAMSVSHMPPYGAPPASQHPVGGIPQQAAPYGQPPPPVQHPPYQPYGSPAPPQGPNYPYGAPGVQPQGGMYAPPPAHGQPQSPYGYQPQNQGNTVTRIGRLGSEIGGKLQHKLTGYLDHLATHAGSSGAGYVRPGAPVYSYGPPVGAAAYGGQPQYGPAQPTYAPAYAAQPAAYGIQPVSAPQSSPAPQPSGPPPDATKPAASASSTPQPSDAPPAYSSQPPTPAATPSQPMKLQSILPAAAPIQSPVSTTTPGTQVAPTPPPASKDTAPPPSQGTSTPAVPATVAVANVAPAVLAAATPPPSQTGTSLQPGQAAVVSPPSSVSHTHGQATSPTAARPASVHSAASLPLAGAVPSPAVHTNHLPLSLGHASATGVVHSAPYQYGAPHGSSPATPASGHSVGTGALPGPYSAAQQPPGRDAAAPFAYGGQPPPTQAASYHYGPPGAGPPVPMATQAPYGAPAAPAAAVSHQAQQPGYPTYPPTYPPTQGGSKYGPLAGLASKLEDMVLSREPSLSDPRGDYDEHPILTTPIRDAGDPETVSRICPRFYDIDYETTWYFLPAAPDFMTCSRCHHYYIAQSPLAGAFQSVRKGGLRCLFHVPRITKRLWPDAVQSGDLTPLADFMRRRTALPHCKGPGGTVEADGVKWFGSASHDIPGFQACETCYESLLLGTGFANRFGPIPALQGPNKRVCSLAYKYVERAIMRHSINPSPQAGWTEFVVCATKRLSLPPCEEAIVVANSLLWYRPPSNPELRYCEACFLDELGLTPFAAQFDLYDPDEQTDFAVKFETIACNLNHASLKELIFVSLAGRRSLDEFKVHLGNVLDKPRCSTDEGIQGGCWHNFAYAPAANYDVCEGCFAGIIVPHGIQRFYTSAPRAAPSQEVRFCDFYHSSGNYRKFNPRFIEMLATGVFASYGDFVRKWAPVLACPGDGLAENREWYGWDDLPVCLECYETFAAGTALAAGMPLQRARRDEETGCALYSPHMREKYTAACAAGNADELRKYSRERWLVYHETVPRMKALLEQAKAENDTANFNLYMSSTYLGTDVMANAAGSSNLAWDAATGSYRSTNRMASDQAWNRAIDGYQRSQDPNLWQEAQELESKWKAVE